MTRSQHWNWQLVTGKLADIWQHPAAETYYLLARWHEQEREKFLDLGCGLGRHSIFFARSGFSVSAYDLSADAVAATRDWAAREHLPIDTQVGDMTHLPYADNSFDCLLSFHVLSHQDTVGVRQALSEIHRVLRPGGEAYFTLLSDLSLNFQRDDYPHLDEHTVVYMDPGPEYEIPHFGTDYSFLRTLLADFNLLDVKQIASYWHDGEGNEHVSWHWFVLVAKPAAHEPNEQM